MEAMAMTEHQADDLRALAAAAEKDGQHIYTHWRDSNASKANEAWHKAASPKLVIGLLDRIAELEALEKRQSHSRDCQRPECISHGCFSHCMKDCK